MAGRICFQGGGDSPVQYFGDHEGRSYYVRYKYGRAEVYGDGPALLEQEIGDEHDSVWTDEETTVYLALIEDAIVRAELATLRLPTIAEAHAHPLHRRGPLPTHLVGLRCGQHVDPESAWRRSARERTEAAADGAHAHSVECHIHVPADEVDEWIAAHSAEHALLISDFPWMWWRWVSVRYSWLDARGRRMLVPKRE